MNTRFVLSALLALSAQATQAQQMRRSGGDGEPPKSGNEPSLPRVPGFPYAGAWKGFRSMPMGGDTVRLQFTVANGKYEGGMLLPNGRTIPSDHLTASATGLTWDSANSGGGVWAYKIRLVSPDSIVGTLVLENAPPEFNPIPRGTLVLKRQ